MKKLLIVAAGFFGVFMLALIAATVRYGSSPLPGWANLTLGSTLAVAVIDGVVGGVWAFLKLSREGDGQP